MKKFLAKTVVLLTTLTLLISLWMPINAFAASNSASVVFVIDDTKSMQTNDKNKLTAVSVKKYIDRLSNEDIGNKVGIVTFSKKVLKTKKITNVDSESNKKAVKNFVEENINQNGSYTNCVVGIKKAVTMLKEDSNEKKAIILVTDGEYDFDTKDGSVKSQLNSANLSLQKQLDTAKADNIKIYTIKIEGKGVANDGLVDFAKITGDTDGKQYTAKNAKEVENDIEDIQKALLEMTDGGSGTVKLEEGKVTEHKFNIPNGVEYAVIQIDYKADIEIRDFVYNDGETVDYTESEETNYLNVRMSRPKSGNTTMSIYSTANQTATITYIYVDDLAITAQLKNPTINTKEGFVVNATVTYKGEPYDNSDNSISVEAVVKDELGKEYASYPMVQIDSTKEFINNSTIVENPGTYTVNVIVSGTDVSSNDMTLIVEKAPMSTVAKLLIILGVLLLIVIIVVVLLVLKEKRKKKPGAPCMPFGRFQVVSYYNYSTRESEAGNIWKLDGNPKINKKTKTITVKELMNKPNLDELNDVVFSAVIGPNRQPILQITNKSSVCLASVNGVAISAVPSNVNRNDTINIEIGEKQVSITANRI